MKIPAMFVHSAGPQGVYEGSGGLIAYLQKSLDQQFEWLCPRMPDPENPRYQHWRDRLTKEFAGVRQEIILVGHSLGASVLLKYLSEEKLSTSIAGLFLVGVPFWGNEEWAIEEFVLKKDFSKRLADIPLIFLYHSLEDAWVPFEHLVQYARIFPGATVRILEGDDHEFRRGLPALVADMQTVYGKLNKLKLNL